MHTYRAHGLGIASEIELPELAMDGMVTGISITVRRGDAIPAMDDQLPDTCICASLDAEGAVFAWKGVGIFRVGRDGAIVVNPCPGSSIERQRLCILGPVLAMALVQRGLLVLHGSGVLVGGGAIAFIGGSGKGKSTLAASLGRRGFPVVADDLLVVELDGALAPLVLPGSPRMRLWPASVEHLGCEPGALPRVHEGVEKRWFCPRSCTEPVPLTRIYLLSQGASLTLTRFDRRQALVAIMRHSFLSQIGRDAGHPSHFMACLRLAHALPFSKLKRPLTFADSGRVEELVLDDAASGIATGSA